MARVLFLYGRTLVDFYRENLTLSVKTSNFHRRYLRDNVIKLALTIPNRLNVWDDKIPRFYLYLLKIGRWPGTYRR